MRFVFAMLLSFTFIVQPVGAQLGEAKGFSQREYAHNLLAERRATIFETSIRTSLSELQQDPKKHINALSAHFSPTDLAEFKKLSYGKTLPTFVFTELQPGLWGMKLHEHTIKFSLLNLYEQTFQLDGQMISFKGASLADLKQRIETAVEKKKTTVFNKVLNELFISDAHAIAPLVLWGLYLAGALIVGWVARSARAAWNESRLPVDQRIARDLANCQGAKTDDDKYEDAFNLGQRISLINGGGVGLMGNLLARFQQGGGGADCTAQFMAEGFSETKADEICANVSALNTCMDSFVREHVANDTDRTIKEVYDSFRGTDERYREYRNGTIAR